MKKVVLFIFVSIFISGCTYSHIPTTEKFDENSGKGLVVIGVGGENGYFVHFSGIDTSSKRILSKSTEVLEHHGKGGDFYKVISMEPGTYVIKNILYSTSRDYRTTVLHTICLNKGTYMFKVKPGEIQYLGNISYEYGGKVKTFISDISVVKNFMKKYPNVKSDNITISSLTPTKFVNGTDIWRRKEVCGGYYYK